MDGFGALKLLKSCPGSIGTADKTGSFNFTIFPAVLSKVRTLDERDSPTKHFAILVPQNPRIGVCELHRIR